MSVTVVLIRVQIVGRMPRQTVFYGEERVIQAGKGLKRGSLKSLSVALEIRVWELQLKNAPSESHVRIYVKNAFSLHQS